MSEASQPTEHLVERWHHLEATRKQCVDQQEAIKYILRGTLPVGKTTTEHGDVTVSVNRRFDDATARSVLGVELTYGRVDPDVVQACWKTTLEPAAVKKIVSPDVYESMMKVVGDPKVTVS